MEMGRRAQGRLPAGRAKGAEVGEREGFDQKSGKQGSGKEHPSWCGTGGKTAPVAGGGGEVGWQHEKL